MYDELLKLCGFEAEEIERERARLDKAFRILDLGPADMKQAENRVRYYFDIELEGVRKLLGIWIKQLVDLVLAREEGKKIVYVSFPAIPGFGLAASLASEDILCQAPELVLDVALGQIFGKIDPILEEAERAGLPPALGMCSLNQARWGGIVKGIVPLPDLTMTSSFFCDQTAKIDDMMHEVYGVDALYVDNCMDSAWGQFEEVTPRQVGYFGREITKALADFQQAVGVELTEEILKSANRENAKLWFALQQILQLMKSDPAPLSQVDIGMLFWMIASPECRAVAEGLPAMNSLLRDGKKRADAGFGKVEKGAPKIFWFSHHFTEPGILRMVEDSGLCMVAGCLPTLSATDMVRAQYTDFGERKAERQLRFGLYESSYGLIRKSAEVCSEWNVDGAIIYYHFACRPMVIPVLMMKKVLEEELGIPVLALEGDFYDIRSYSPEALRTRVETFAEMLRARKAAAVA